MYFYEVGFLAFFLLLFCYQNLKIKHMEIEEYFLRQIIFIQQIISRLENISNISTYLFVCLSVYVTNV